MLGRALQVETLQSVGAATSMWAFHIVQISGEVYPNFTTELFG